MLDERVQSPIKCLKYDNLLTKPKFVKGKISSETENVSKQAFRKHRSKRDAKQTGIRVLCLCVFVLIMSCSPNQTSSQLQLTFTPYYQNEALSCDLTFHHGLAKWQLQTLGFFVSSFTINTDDVEGARAAVNLLPSNWQTQDTALIWFTPNCDNNTLSTQANHTLTMQFDSANAKPIQTLSFELSVPFASNHKNPLTQPFPLNNPNMFWSWQAGHKFMRMDATQVNGNANWAFHLGSVGCVSKSSLRAPMAECSHPNRIKVRLDMSKQLRKAIEIAEQNKYGPIAIKFDIDALLDNIDIAGSKPCMFALDQQQSCALLMQNLVTNPIFSVIDEGKKP
ncbi:MAG: putative repeat protein (TIGR04052 family) [Alphaproteobacteria bacterium]|jgi:uncharacterized repeat protein (TIGR04052 family)